MPERYYRRPEAQGRTFQEFRSRRHHNSCYQAISLIDLWEEGFERNGDLSPTDSQHQGATLRPNSILLAIVRELANENKKATMLAHSALICAESGRKPLIIPATHPTENPPTRKRSPLSRAAL